MNKNKYKFKAGAVIVLAAAELVYPTMGFTQEGDGDDASGIKERFSIEEIVVTATKRAASLQDVAMSISAIGGEEMGRRGLEGMDDYLRTMPGLNFVDRGAGVSEIVIRGASTDLEFGSASTGPAVAVYFNDVPITGLSNFGSSLDVKLVDMERVEVLRGPQGTLYGSSSLSGTVRNIPAAPKVEEFQAKVDMSYSNTGDNGGNNGAVQGAVNIPLIEDRLAVRVVGYEFDNSGYYKNIASSDPDFSATAASFGVSNLALDEDEVGREKTSGGRISALWKPTENLDVTLMYVKQDTEQDGAPQESLSVGKYLQTNYQIADVFGGGSPRLSVDFDITNLVFEYNFGWGSLLSSTSYTNVDSEHVYDDLGLVLGGAPFPIENVFDAENFVEEIRFSSALDGPSQFIIGLYYEDFDRQYVQTAHFAGADLALNPLPNLDPLGDPSLLLRENPIVQREQSAAYGEFSYAITDKLEATAGLRYFDYDRRNRVTSSGRFGRPPRGEEGGESGTTYKLNVTYSPSDDDMFYAQFAQGFRLGRTIGAHPPTCDLDNDGLIDGTGVPSGAEVLPSDTIDSYELGGKLDLFANGRLRVNFSAFQSTWKNIPVTIVPPCNFLRFVAEGEAKTQGFELETTLSVTEGLLLTFGGSRLEAQLEGDSSLGSDGDRLPGSPEYNLNAGVHYAFQVDNRNTFAQLDYVRVGGFHSDIAQATTEAGDYSQLNLRAGMDISDNYDIQLFANNLANSDGITYVNKVDLKAYRLRPRTVGVKLGIEF